MLLTELLFPLDADGIVDTYHLFRLKELVEKKREFEFYTADRKNGKKYPFDSFSDYGTDEFIAPVDVTKVRDSFYITSGRQRGIPSILANIMGISRQSVEKTLKSANIFVARNMSISALKFMTDTEK